MIDAEFAATGNASTRLFHTLVFGNTGHLGAFVSGDAPAPAAKSAHPPAPSPAAASVAVMRMRPRIPGRYRASSPPNTPANG